MNSKCKIVSQAFSGNGVGAEQTAYRASVLQFLHMIRDCQLSQVNKLECFYPPNSLQLKKLFTKANNVDFRAMASLYNMPLELTMKLVTLAM